MKLAIDIKTQIYKQTKRQHKIALVLTLISILAISAFAVTSTATNKIVEDLPFRNNHQRNMLYASQLYNANEREEALRIYYDMIAAYKSAEQKENEADVHDKLADLFYGKDKQWNSEKRSAEEQQAWIHSRNSKAIEELSEFFKCFIDADLTRHPKDDNRYDRNFIRIITCFEENQDWAAALDWLSKYESFRNPTDTTYDDEIDLIKYKKAEYHHALKNYQQALMLYRQVAFGFDTDEKSQYSPKALVKYKELQKQLRPELYQQLTSKAVILETAGDWDGALTILIYAEKYAPDNESHLRLIETFQQRRNGLLEKHLEKVNEALEKQQWQESIAALEDSLTFAGDRPDLLNLLRACRLAQKGDVFAEELNFEEAAEIFDEAAALTENNSSFLKRAEQCRAEASKDIDAQLSKARDLMVEGGLANYSEVIEIISEILSTRPKHEATISLLRELHSKPVSVDIGNGIQIQLVLVPQGEFSMGSPDNEQGREANEGPQRAVKITSPFWMAVTEVTQVQYQTIIGNNSGATPNVEYPVEVSWNEAANFCDKLSGIIGHSVRLPSEAEWEYACRAGTTTRFSFGDNENLIGDYAWFRTNAYDIDENYAHAVAHKKPNPWGLYDMHGNLWEWCNDWYGDKNSSTETLIDPNGPSSGEYRVLRGGSWFSAARHCRSASRYWLAPDGKENIVGFRVVVDVKQLD